MKTPASPWAPGRVALEPGAPRCLERSNALRSIHRFSRDVFPFSSAANEQVSPALFGCKMNYCNENKLLIDVTTTTTIVWLVWVAAALQTHVLLFAY